MDMTVDRRRSQALSGVGAIWVAAAALAIMFAGSTLVTPLYAVYRQEFGFSELTLTLIYAVYAIGNLSALLLLGRLSDQVGRRRVLLAAISLGVVSSVLFLVANDLGWLFAGRMVSGFAIGLASGTSTAWIAELHSGQDKARATITAASANLLGLAVGAIVAGVLSQYAPWPMHLSFIVYLGVLGVLAALVWMAPETVRQPVTHFAQLSLRPRVGVPRRIWAQFFAPAMTAFSSFALLGFYVALAPTILIEDMHQRSRAVGGGVVFELCLVAALTVIATRNLKSRTAMLSGLVLMLPSLGLLVWAQTAHSMPILLIGTTLTGISNALCYRGSLQVINQITPAAQRSEVISTLFVTGFTGNSLPIIGVGVLANLTDSLVASTVFTWTLAVLAIAALLVGAKYTPRQVGVSAD